MLMEFTSGHQCDSSNLPIIDCQYNSVGSLEVSSFKSVLFIFIKSIISWD